MKKGFTLKTFYSRLIGVKPSSYSHTSKILIAQKPDVSKKFRGFTLIELLVVIAIIGVLSTIVLSSLNAARAKSKDVAIKTQVSQFKALMEQNYNDYGSYSNLQTGNWYTIAGTGGYALCSSINLGSYSSQAASLCYSIISMEPNNNNIFYLGNNINNANNYSVMAYLPSKGTYFCVGSSGRNSDTETGTPTWLTAGCYGSP